MREEETPRPTPENIRPPSEPPSKDPDAKTSEEMDKRATKAAYRAEAAHDKTEATLEQRIEDLRAEIAQLKDELKSVSGELRYLDVYRARLEEVAFTRKISVWIASALIVLGSIALAGSGAFEDNIFWKGATLIGGAVLSGVGVVINFVFSIIRGKPTPPAQIQTREIAN